MEKETLETPTSEAKPQEEKDFSSVKSEETVEVSKQELVNLMDRVKHLERMNPNVKIEDPKFRTARVWFEDAEMKNVVVGYGKSRDSRDVDGSIHTEMELIYKTAKDETKTKWVRMNEFRDKGTSVVAKIIETKDVGQEKVMGWTKRKDVDYANYRTTETNEDVPMKVVEPKIVHNLQLPDGRVFTLSVDALN